VRRTTIAAIVGALAACTGVALAMHHHRALGRGVGCPSALKRPWRCRRLSVRLDPAGRTPGRLTLAVAEYHRPGPARPAVLAFAGGPGGAAIPKAGKYRQILAPLLARRDLVVFDQRGTGVSAPMSCPGIEGRASWPPAAIARCGRRLGRRGRFSATADSAADAEAVRRALHIPRVVLYGVSYGTKTATDYARRYPRHVDAMVLDSVVVADTDPLYRRSAAAAGRILDALCAEARCASDPVADLETLVAHMRGGVLRGRADGRPVRILEGEILNAIVEGEASRPRLPAALHAAAAGDLAPLEDALPDHVADVRDDAWSAAAFSATTYLATTCEDASFPWRRSASSAARRRAARRWLATQRDGDYGPFNHEVGRQYGVTGLCEAWPAAGRLAVDPALPDVPALLLAGEVDALTPLEGAREVAAELPRARLVVVGGHDHVVLSTAGPAAVALRAWARTLPGR
jgi:pimeloyl-ACP methyl ester carboxylesterase